MYTIIKTKDLRQEYLYDYLKDKIECCISEQVMSSKVIFPIANYDVDKYKLENVSEVITGKIDIRLNKNITKSYFNEELIIENAKLTAEGVLCKIIEESDKSLEDLSVTIIGYGRCGQILAHKLSRLGVMIKVKTRNNNASLAAKLSGYEVIDEINDNDILVNTADALTIDKEVINRLNNAIVIDIASTPGGVDFKYCDELKIKNFHMLGIPGKFSPKSAAKIIGIEILKMIK